jgi:hypothetical protein
MFPKAQEKSMKQKKQIVIEEEETVMLRGGGSSITGFCPFCSDSVVMATPWIAAKLHGFSEREIFRMIERGAIYVTEGDRILTCLSCVDKVSIGTARPPTDIQPVLREQDRLTDGSRVNE